MTMQMRHGFPSVPAVVDDQSEAGIKNPQLPGDGLRLQEQMSE